MKFAALLLFVNYLAAQPPSHLANARAAEAAGDFSKAEREYDQLLKTSPNAEIYQRLGLIRHLQNKFTDAIPAFKSSLKLNPDQWAAHLFLGIDLYRTNQFSNAFTELQIAGRLKPGDPEVRFWSAVTNLALKQYFPGLETLEELAQEQPKNLEILRLLAENYATLGTSLVNHVAEKYPDTAAGMTIHAQALEFEGAGKAALAVYQTIRARWPNRSGVSESIERLELSVSAKPLP